MNIFIKVLLCFFVPGVWASDFSSKEIQEELNSYLGESSLPVNTLYPKKDNRGKIIRDTGGIFSSDEVLTTEFVKQKLNSRRVMSADYFYSEPERNDNPRALIEGDAYTDSILEMEKHGLQKGEVYNKPWSDDYWPHHKGGPAARYNDDKFPNSSEWNENFDYVSKNPFYIVFESSVRTSIDNLSPAEKYDLLVNEKSGSLTKALWEEGEYYYKAHGKVEAWMGICHGWAAASYMSPRPKKAIEVLAFDGKTKIKFFPDDIKALQSLLWANTRTQTLFAGERCNDRNPPLDENGRPKKSECRDSNPATWHNTIVNRVGLSKQSFVLDATFDYQVWNQPIIKYSYSYFNPQTMKVAKLDEARIDVANFPNDKFAKHRSREASSIVGVTMQVTYGVETSPTHSESDVPENDLSRTVLYVYDLELDSNGNILGGEWYKTPHPDFLWTPTKDAKALAKNDYYLLGQPNWDGKSALSDAWKKHAEEAAVRSQPLAKILNSLVEISNKH
ncbi:MAG: hypothetical protein A4S09_03820 [Proteobacteria bacterium SG_bin7]|nr:MAG: hypothetical protein A4S09_03820 [Proteobacteria bacterium SG_bin7]